jgi:hypothetical protein
MWKETIVEAANSVDSSYHFMGNLQVCEKLLIFDHKKKLDEFKIWLHSTINTDCKDMMGKETVKGDSNHLVKIST